MDHRIGPFFLKSSVAFGGSCFKKDILNFFSVLESFVENNPSLTKSKETISEQI